MQPDVFFNFEVLRNCEEVTIVHCDWMTHVPEAFMRSSIKRVWFHKCLKLKDIASLEGIPCIELHACHAIKNYHPLGRSESVTIWNCDGFPCDCLALRGVNHVYLGQLMSLTSLDGLQTATTVELYSCSAILDMQALRGVHEVSLVSMALGPNLSFLANSSVVNIDNCVVPQGLYGLDSVQCGAVGVRSLHIYDCFAPDSGGLQTITCLPHCTHLSVYDQHFIKDLSHFTGLEFLEIINCKSITTIPAQLHNIERVIIKGCPSIIITT